MNNPRIVIAATQSNAGKTSVSIALAHSLVRRGLRVQTYKVGPDFLDPSYLAIASGRPCYNLDGWMSGKEYVEDLFRRSSEDADIALIEGVMGLFDGASPDSLEGSTAEIARWLNAPVVLLANGEGVSRSFAAMVQGYHTFEPGLTLSGVIANHCGSVRHAAWLSDALAIPSLPPLLGTVPKKAFPVLPSRHLGLVSAEAKILTAPTLDAFADALERCVDVDAILRLANSAPPLSAHPPAHPAGDFDGGKKPALRIGIAHDKAFHFYYPDNLEALKAQGADLIFFSPLTDSHLPEKLDAIYLGGGYPEEHAAVLCANTAMHSALRLFVARGGTLYAECGGLMYLSNGIEMRDGARYPMTGILPVWTRMHSRRRMLGYVEVMLTADTLWGRRGDRLRGHEFHYSQIVNSPAAGDGWQTVYEMRYGRQAAPVLEGFQRGRVLASYAHLHFASRPAAVRSIIGATRRNLNSGNLGYVVWPQLQL